MNMRNTLRINRLFEENQKNTLTEQEFLKAIQDFNLEVYTLKGIEDYVSKVKAKGNKEEIQKAKEEIASLQKINLIGDLGKRRNVWIKRKNK